MWSKVNFKDVAGSIRKNVSTFANEVAKQAQTFTEEEGEEDDEEESVAVVQSVDRKELGLQGSSRQTDSKREANMNQAMKTSIHSASNLSSNGAPDATRIAALKARLEAKKAQRESANKEPNSTGRELSRSRERKERVTLLSSKDSATTQQDTQGTSSEKFRYQQKVQAEEESSPPLPVAQSSPEDHTPPRRQQVSSISEIFRSGDFVDIPLRSPASARALLSRANGAINSPQQDMSPAKAGNPAPKSETELLKDQLQRLKQQMVSSNAAQDEEMSSLRQELAVVVKEKDELYAQRTKHESLKREQLAGASASKEKQAQELRIVAVETEAEEKFQQLEDKYSSDLNQKQQELAQREAELQAIKDQLDCLKQERSTAAVDKDRWLFQQAQIDEARQKLQIEEELNHRSAAEAEVLHASLVAVQKQVKVLETASRDIEASHAQSLQRLESDLRAERDAHEATLRDAEASLLELESIREHGYMREAQDVSIERETDAHVQAENFIEQAEAKWQEKEARWLEQVDGLQVRLRASDSAVESLQERAENAETAAAASIRQSEDQSASLAGLQETLDQLGRENLSLKACVDEGREHLAEAKDEIEGFEKRLAEATVLLHQTQRAAQDRERDLQERMHDNLEEHRKRAADLEQQLRENKASRAQDVENLRQQCTRLDLELKAAESQAKQAASKLELQSLEQQAEVNRLHDAVEAERRTSRSLQERLESTTYGTDGSAELEVEAQEIQDGLQRQLLTAQAVISRLGAEQDLLRSQHRLELDKLGRDLTGLQQALRDAEADRDKAKQQLARLKIQMVSEQDAEDDKLSWKIEAEVQVATRESIAAKEAAEARSRDLSMELEASKSQAAVLEESLTAWEAAVAERDAEIGNLQSALGELTYESEAAERLRAEIRAERASARDLKAQLSQAKAAVERAGAAKDAAEAALVKQQEKVAEQQAREARLEDEANMLRRAVQEGMKRINLLNSDSSAMVDRRVVVKLLITYFQRGQSPEILELMARMLGLSDSDKAAIKGSKLGILQSVAAVPRSLLSRANSSISEQAKESLADSWVDFLVQQAHAADVVESQTELPDNQIAVSNNRL